VRAIDSTGRERLELLPSWAAEILRFYKSLFYFQIGPRHNATRLRIFLFHPHLF